MAPETAVKGSKGLGLLLTLMDLPSRIAPTVLICRANSGLSSHRELGVAQSGTKTT